MIRMLWAVAGVVAGGVLGWYMLRDIELREVLRSIGGLDWRLLVLAVGAVLFAGFLEALRWKLLLPAEKVSARRLFLIKNVGKGLNNLSPIRVVAEVAQATMLRCGEGVGTSKIVSSLLLVRMFDLLVTVSLVGAGLIVLPQLAGLRPVVLPLWGVSVGAMAILLLLAKRLHRLPGMRRFGMIQPFLQAVGAMGGKRGIMLVSLVLTAVAWMAIGTAAWLVGRAAGVDLPVWLMAIVIVAVSFVSSGMPAPPGAVGVYEFAVVSTLGLFAIDGPSAMTFALVIHALLFIPPVLIAAVVLAADRRTVRQVFAALAAALALRKTAAAL